MVRDQRVLIEILIEKSQHWEKCDYEIAGAKQQGTSPCCPISKEHYQTSRQKHCRDVVPPIGSVDVPLRIDCCEIERQKSFVRVKPGCPAHATNPNKPRR